MRFIKTLLTAIAAFLAFAIAFRATCNAGGQDIMTGLLALLAGLAAAVMVCVFVFQLQSRLNSDRNPGKPGGRREQR